MVCHYCSKNRDTVLRRFGSAAVANAGIKGTLRFRGVFRDIPTSLPFSDYGARGVLRVCNSTFLGTVGVLTARGVMGRGKDAKLVQLLVNGAQGTARAVRPRRWVVVKANAKGHVRLESIQTTRSQRVHGSY